MKKNYNFNYINRQSVQKPAVEISGVDVATCTSKVLAKSPITDGKLWHTTDSDEFYYDWNGKRKKLNLTGSSEDLLNEVNKIKSDVAKLNPAKMDQLETKVNSAVSKVNSLKNTVDSAVADAREASQAARNAATQVANKVDSSDLASVAFSGKYSDLKNKPTIPTVPTKISTFTNDAGYLTQHQDISGKADKSELFSGNYNDLSNKPELFSGSYNDLEDKPTIPTVPTNISDFTNDAGYLTTTNQKFPNSWHTDGTMADLISDINSDTTATAGKTYISTVRFSDLPISTDPEWPNKKLNQGELKVEIMSEIDGTGKVILFTLTSTLKPYHWEYSSIYGATDEWKSFGSDDVVVPTNVSDFTNDAGYLTADDLPDYLTDSDLPDMAGSFPAGDDVDNVTADEDGIATVQDVMNYVNAFFEKKKDELDWGSEVPVAVPYLYTNGYRRGDTATELTDPFNGYEIVLDGNGEFVIELLHKNETDGYFDLDGDPEDNEQGVYFKVVLPTGYSVKVYTWDEDNNAYSSTSADISDPSYELVAYNETPDNITYYYSVVVSKFLFAGAKFGIEDYINAYGHLLKLVVTKNN